MFLSAQPSMGGWPAGGAGRCLGTGRCRPASSPEPHQVGDSGRSQRPCRPVAGCPPLSCTMSDGEGPSAGKWQRYIYLLQVRLQGQGHWSPGVLPPPRAVSTGGLDPFLLACCLGACAPEGGARLSKLSSATSTPASRCGWSRKLCLLQTLLLSARASSDDPQRSSGLGCGRPPGWAQGATGPWNCSAYV